MAKDFEPSIPEQCQGLDDLLQENYGETLKLGAQIEKLEQRGGVRL